jgi:hypothetical protein
VLSSLSSPNSRRNYRVYLVNAHSLKTVPGRKSDVSDCEWIQYLHSVGLLKASFRPPEAQGITVACEDIGAEEIYVAVPPDRDEQATRRFSSFTCDLYALAEWLECCRVRTVAMESTGVYWIPLFQILEERGFKETSVRCALSGDTAAACSRWPPNTRSTCRSLSA